MGLDLGFMHNLELVKPSKNQGSREGIVSDFRFQLEKKERGIPADTPFLTTYNLLIIN
mgnify:CR=1 FL=1